MEEWNEVVLRLGGLRTTSKEGAGFLDGLKASSSLEVRLVVLESVEVSACSVPVELRAKFLNREKVLLEGSVSGC